MNQFVALVDRLFLVFFVLFYAILLCVPVARIFKRVGLSPWLSMLAIVPLLNLFGLWIFAFSPWPSDSVDQQEAEWSEADKEKFRQLMRQQ